MRGTIHQAKSRADELEAQISELRKNHARVLLLIISFNDYLTVIVCLGQSISRTDIATTK